MSDIVERLRLSTHDADADRFEAADLITRLRVGIHHLEAGLAAAEADRDRLRNLLFQARASLLYHTAQTRPIGLTDSTVKMIDAALKASE